MIKNSPLLILGLLLLAFHAQFGMAQEPASIAPQGVAVELLESEIARTEAAENLSEETRSRLDSLYREALSNLQEAESHEASARAFLESQQTAPVQAESIREALEASNAAEPGEVPGISQASSLREIESLIQREKAQAATAEAHLVEVSTRLNAENARPASIRQRLPKAEDERAASLARLDQFTPTEDAAIDGPAQRWLFISRAAALKAESEMLKQELLSHPARLDLLKAQRDKARADAELFSQRLEFLEDLATAKRQEEARRTQEETEAKRLDAEGKHPLVLQLAEQNAVLSRKIAEEVSQLDALANQAEETRRLARQLEGDFESTQEVLAIGGASVSEQLGNLLRQQRQALPDHQSFERKAREREEKASEVGVSRALHRREQQRLMDVDTYVDRLLGDSVAEEGYLLRTQLLGLASERSSLLDKAIESENVLLRKLGELEVAQTELLETIKRFDELLDVHLLWVRSVSRTELEQLGALPYQVWRIVSPSGWKSVVDVLLYQASHSVVFILLAVVFALFFWVRNRLIAFIKTTSKRLGKPTTDRFVYTLQVLIVTLLAAAAWPLAAVVVGWQLQVSPQATDFSVAVGGALLSLAMHFYFLRALRLICLPHGLAAAHFRWPEPTLNLLRRELDRLSWTYLPAVGVTLIIVSLDPLNAGWAVGRAALIIVVLSLSIAIFRLLHPKRGVFAHVPVRSKLRKPTFLYQFWYYLLVVMPLVLGVMVLLGYLYTAETLLNHFVNSILMVVGLLIASALAKRWLLVARRRIAYEAAMERRRASIEARKQSEQQDEAEGVSTPLEVEEPEIDLESLSDTSSDLIRTTIIFSSLVGLWLIWSDVLPALRILDNVSVWHQTITVEGRDELDPITLRDIILALVIGIATVVLARQFPSFLELILLRRFDMTAGARYTVTTLTNYTVVTVGILLAFNIIGAQWSQLQWLVAALGVGIGFGLQEIVANFISGLIILFERPIRVGDVVTVGDTDGVVTKIRIRATTIRNWDRKELLVPNKEFVTGRLLNWSLSDQVTRVVVAVGVAYGSDVDKALALMHEAAEEHERVLDDPPPLVSFEGFGDNSLNLILRAYIGSVDYRIPTITDLHKAINRKLEQAGITIAFPQRDLHLDTKGPLKVEIQHRDGDEADSVSRDKGGNQDR